MKYLEYTFITITFLFIFITTENFPQQQHHIHWPSLADSPWPISRGDAQATGRSQYVGPKTPNVIWRKDMPLGIFHGPVIGYNNVLFMGTRAANFSENINYFYSIDADGNEMWKYNTKGYKANVSGATIANDGSIYFSSLSGGLYALNANGTYKWQNSKFIHGYQTRYISVAKNGNILIPWNDTLFVLNPASGLVIDSSYIKDVWDKEFVFSTGGDTMYYIIPGALISTTLDGTLLWEYNLGNNSGTPVVDNNNRIYLYGTQNSDEFLFCINPDGTLNWKYPFPFGRYENYSSPTIDSEGNIYFQLSSSEGYIISLDYFGNFNWMTSLGQYNNDGAFINHGLVCDAEGKIYCGSSLGNTTNFWCIERNGEILWKLNLEGYQYDTSPAINNDGTLYIGTHIGSTDNDQKRNLIAVNDNDLSVDGDKNWKNFQLHQNYPNPFNPATHIDYTIMDRTNVTLKVFNIMGEEVSTLVNKEQIPGYYSKIFDAKDLPSGVYFYELTTDKTRFTKKMLLLR